jgi:micrococcal nuclease
MSTREPSRKLLWFWWLVLITLVVISVIIALKIKDIKIPFSQSPPGLYSVTKVHDGDTISVNMNGKTEIIRMIGVDTPESHRPNTPVQCYAQEATNFTKSLISENRVRLQADPLNTNRDRYNRLLRYIYLPDGTLLQTRIITDGYGFAYTQFPFVRAIEFEVLENQAEKAKKGLWNACQVRVEPSGLEQTNPAN